MTKATIVKDVIMGDNIVEMIVRCKSVYNLSTMTITNIDPYKLYLVTKEIGYNEDYKKSGVFFTQIVEVTDNLVKEMM